MVKIVKTTTEAYDETELQRILDELKDCYESAKKILVVEPDYDSSTTIEETLDQTKKCLIAGDMIYLGDFMRDMGFFISAWNRSPWVDKRWKLTITRTENEEVIGS